MIRILLWDIDGTLFDFAACERAALQNSLEKNKIIFSDEVFAWYNQKNAEMWSMLERGEITRERLMVARFECLFEHFAFKGDPSLFAQDYHAFLSETHILMKDALNVLEKLHGKIPMYVVTNGFAKTQHARLKASLLEKYFEDIFISEEIGAQKPETKFFDLCFEKIGNVCRDEVLIIGDSLSSDIKGGINAGIKTCWFNPNGKKSVLPITYEINALTDIFAVLKDEDLSVF